MWLRLNKIDFDNQINYCLYIVFIYLLNKYLFTLLIIINKLIKKTDDNMCI